MTIKEAIEAINGAEIMSLNTPIRKLQSAVLTLMSAAKRASIYDKKLFDGEMIELAHGHWKKSIDDLGIDRGWVCSRCKGSVYQMTYEPYKFCPHCGACMDQEVNEE